MCSWLALGAMAIAQPGPAASSESAPGYAGAAPALSPQIVPIPPSKDWESKARAFGGFEWVSRPSRDAIMGFTIPMEVQEVRVVGGQRVKRGELLIRGRDAEVVASIEVQRVRSVNDAPVKNAEASLELARIRLRTGQEAFAKDALNQSEIDERVAQVKSSEAAVANAKSDMKEEAARLVQLEKQLERYRLEAPFDGVVEAVACEVGQAFEQAGPVVRVVSIDPVWIDVPTPTDETLIRGLKAGDSAWVLFDAPGAPESDAVVKGKVLDVSRVVDTSGSRRVRVEAPNPREWPAGVRVRVRFSPPVEGESPKSAAAAK